MEKIGVEALVAICKEGNGQERVEETYPLSGAGQFVSIQNDNMAEMQGRMIRLLTMLMKKDVVLSCVPEVMGVVEGGIASPSASSSPAAFCFCAG